MRTALDDRTESDRTGSVEGQFSSSAPLAIGVQLGLGCLQGSGAARGGLQRLRTRRGPELLWVSHQAPAAAPVMARVRSAEAGLGAGAGAGAGVRICSRVLDDPGARRLLGEHGGSWSRAVAIEDEQGAHIGSIWRALDGS